MQAARQAQDEVTVQVLTDQLRPAEQLATQLKRFQQVALQSTNSALID